MSAIAAVVFADGAPGDARAVVAMLEAMAHRCPDGTATYADGSAALGQGLLCTTREGQRCTIVRGAGSGAVVVADARIDNRLELCESLSFPTSSSDEAILLAAWERWGDDCAAHILGDFAFAIWDPSRKRLFAARDPFGVRTLYWHSDRRAFACATEPAGLFALPSVPRTPDRLAVGLFLACLHLEYDRTLYAGVHPLPPAHALTVHRGVVRSWPYWQPDPWKRSQLRSTEAYVEEFRELFSDAVRARLRADRPVAATVSGGLDSSSVACEAERLRQTGKVDMPPTVLLRLLFPELPCDERGYSDLVSARWGLPIASSFPLDDRELCRPTVAKSRGDVLFFPTLINQEPMLAQAKAAGARVVLYGVGSELVQCHTGYEPGDALRALRFGDLWRGLYLDEQPFSARRWSTLARTAASMLAPERIKAAARRRYRLPVRSLTPSLAREVVEYRADMIEEEARRPGPDQVTRVMCATVAWGAGQLFQLALIDRFHAQRGLDARFPFLDRRLVEFLLAAPHDQRVGLKRDKLLQRAALRGTLPDAIADRDDFAEFTPYVQRAFLEPYRDEIARILRSSRAAAAGFVDSKAIAALLRDPATTPRIADEISNLTALELWLGHLPQ